MDGGERRRRLRAVLPCHRERGEELLSTISVKGDMLLRGFYDREDARGDTCFEGQHVRSGDARPLLAVEAGTVAEVPLA